MATILLIDDDATGLPARAALLKAMGYDVLTADTALAGLDLASEQHVDAVVLDYRLPDLSGLETLKELRAINPTLKVIVLSGMLQLPEEMTKAATEVIVKGSGALRLLDALARHTK